MDKNFNVYFRDIILAHVPREKFSYPNGKKIGNGKIEELAIISADGQRFILVDEFEEGIVRNMKDYFLLGYSRTGYFYYHPTFTRLSVTPNVITLGADKTINVLVSLEEEENRKLPFEKLEKQNQKIIKQQFDVAIQLYNSEQEHKKKRRAENAERAIYNNF